MFRISTVEGRESSHYVKAVEICSIQWMRSAASDYFICFVVMTFIAAKFKYQRIVSSQNAFQQRNLNQTDLLIGNNRLQVNWGDSGSYWFMIQCFKIGFTWRTSCTYFLVYKCTTSVITNTNSVPHNQTLFGYMLSEGLITTEKVKTYCKPSFLF